VIVALAQLRSMPGAPGGGARLPGGRWQASTATCPGPAPRPPPATPSPPPVVTGHPRPHGRGQDDRHRAWPTSTPRRAANRHGDSDSGDSGPRRGRQPRPGAAARPGTARAGTARAGRTPLRTGSRATVAGSGGRPLRYAIARLAGRPWPSGTRRHRRRSCAAACSTSPFNSKSVILGRRRLRQHPRPHPGAPSNSAPRAAGEWPGCTKRAVLLRTCITCATSRDGGGNFPCRIAPFCASSTMTRAFTAVAGGSSCTPTRTTNRLRAARAGHPTATGPPGSQPPG